MKFPERFSEAIRLAVLQALALAPGYAASMHILHQVVNMRSIKISLDMVIAALEWLETAGLVDIERLRSSDRDLLVATLSPRGLDVAHGRERATGVRRPIPTEIEE